MNPGVEKDYALDFGSVIRFVATQMEAARVEDRAVSIDDMARTYDHRLAGDLFRVRLHHGLGSDQEAERFLVEQAVEHLGDRVEAVNGGFRLARPLKGMRYPPLSGPRGVIHPIEDPHARFGDPFNPMGGTFTDNIRRNTARDSMDELRESMRAVGWLPGHPAIRDERGVVLVGHRRLAVAKELNIEPEIIDLRFGTGDDADFVRLQLAAMSNAGAKPFTPEERKRIAEVLYAGGEGETMEKIAGALGVTAMTVSRYLTGVKPPRERGGRPRKRSILDPEHPLTLDPDRERRALSLLDEGAPIDEVAQTVGVSDQPIRRLIERERGRREAHRSKPTSAESPSDIGPVEPEEHRCPDCGALHRDLRRTPY